MNWKKTLILCAIIILVGAGLTTIIFSTEPKATRVTATKKTAMLVEVTTVHRGTFEPHIVAMGAVLPAQDIMLSPRVGGEIVRRSPSFTPGGFVNKGETLLQIDPADYRNIVQQRESDLRQATTELNLEQGRQTVAEKDYQLVADDVSIDNKDLVLRKPQLAAAQARVDAAQAAVDQAKLDLQRTTISAPFDAHIITRNANIGSQVSPGETLGRLVGLDTYWVETTVPVATLRWLEFPENADEMGAEVQVRNRVAWAEDEYRTGYLHRLIAALDDDTRMARVLVDVPDPLAREPENEGAPVLMIGSFVETRIQARPIENVVRLSRDYVRQNDTVWVMKDSKLEIRDLDIIFRDAEYAYVSSGLNDNEKVVTSNLSTVVNGAELRVAEGGQ